MKEGYLELLRRQLKELEKIGNNPITASEYSFGVDAWKSSTIAVIERIFGKDSRKIQEIERIELGRTVSLRGPHQYHIETVKETGRSIIEACIAEIDLLGIPEEKYTGDQKGINLTLMQSQSNQQSVKLEMIVSVLREELTGRQLEEIQEILEGETDPERRKESTIEKLKEFGLNTLAGILAGIITNSTVWGI